MILFQALRNRPIFFLWVGQSLSAVGDELYRMAFVWILAGMVGHNTGFYTTLQQISLLIVTLFGGVWADRWHPYRTLISVDLIRFFLNFIPVIFMLFFKDHALPALVVTAILIAGTGGFFEPVIKMMIPAYCRTSRELQGATGLMSTTFRFARVIAPIIIASLSAWVAPIYYFAIDAFTYLASAMSIYFLWKRFKPVHPLDREHVIEKVPIQKVLSRAIVLLREKPQIWRMAIFKVITGGLWHLGYGLGIVFLVKAKFGNDLAAFSIAMKGYGVGNLFGALYFGNRERKRPVQMMYLGLGVLGIGFLGMGLAPSLTLLFIAAAVSAIGGPLNDIPFHDVVQTQFNIKDVPAIYRFTLALETAASLITVGLSPFVFREATPVQVLCTIGILTLACSIYGLVIEAKAPALHHKRNP